MEELLQKVLGLEEILPDLMGHGSHGEKLQAEKYVGELISLAKETSSKDTDEETVDPLPGKKNRKSKDTDEDEG